jgi:hypothetical protein
MHGRSNKKTFLLITFTPLTTSFALNTEILPLKTTKID